MNKIFFLSMVTFSFSALAADYDRQVEVGEQVILANSYGAISWQNENGDKFIVNIWGSRFPRHGIKRSDVAVTSGCLKNICVGDTVLEVSSGDRMKVAGLSYRGEFIVSNGKFLAGPMDKSALAVTHGCVEKQYMNICVGDMISTGTYGTELVKVVGITDDKVLVTEKAK